MTKPSVLIIVENLPVPLDRRVWQESCALRDAGYDVRGRLPMMFEAKFGKRGIFYWCVRLAERLNYACADVVLATNESVKQVAIARGKKSAEKIFTVRTAPQIATAGVPPDPSLKKGKKYLVGYIGVMGNADGVNYLVEAAGHI